MRYILTDNNGTITDEQCAINVPTGAIAVPDSYNGSVGQNIKEFDTDFNLRPLADRYAEGFITLPDNLKLSDDKQSIVLKSDIELMADGLKEIPDKHKLSEDKKSIIPKTLSELVADGEISEDEAVEEARNIIRELRQEAFAEVDRRAVIAMYEKTELSKSWIKYREEWLQAPNNISTLKDFELWTPPATPVGGL